jgi:hypothetical protein
MLRLRLAIILSGGPFSIKVSSAAFQAASQFPASPQHLPLPGQQNRPGQSIKAQRNIRVGA